MGAAMQEWNVLYVLGQLEAAHGDAAAAEVHWARAREIVHAELDRLPPAGGCRVDGLHGSREDRGRGGVRGGRAPHRLQAQRGRSYFAVCCCFSRGSSAGLR